jgi:phage terminase large subunit-like protein
MEVFEDLRVVDVPGSPRMGDISRDWVKDFAAAIFGAYDPDTGRRLIREFFLLVSKKNTKSTISGGVMLTALMRNWRMSAEFLILAPTLEVANNAFFPARDMVKADDEMAELLHVQEHLKTITHRVTGAKLKVVAADNDTVSGKKATAVLIDELWLFGKKANAENMLREATGGLVSRPEGFVAYLSTQSDEPPAGVFKQKLDFFRDIRDGKHPSKRQYLPVIYEFPEEMVKQKAYLDPKNFYVTNPNLGASVDAEWIIDKLSEAEAAGEDSVRGFVAKHLNVEIGLTLRADRWAGAEYWEAAAIPLTLDELLKRCEVVTIGCDGGGLDDLFGLAVIGREIGTGHWLSWSKCWANTKALERRKSEEAKLRDFEREGDLGISDRVGDDFDEAVEIIAACYDAGKLSQVGLDAAGVAAFVDAINLRIYGVAEAPECEDPLTLAVPQGYQLQMASKGVERKLADGTFFHADQAIMDWMVGNAKTEMKGNAVYITKAVSGVGKIDGLMALFDAAFLMARNPQARAFGDIDLVMV